MADLTVANYLAALQDDPWDQDAFRGLNEVIASGDQERLGKDPVRLLEFARRNHEVRGESLAAAKLMESEISLVGSDPDFAAVLYRELGRIRRDELMDDAGARDAYTKALELRPGDEEVQRTIEQLEQVSARFQELADHFMEQAKQATDATLKTSLLVRAASILWQHKKKGKNKDVDRLFKEALHTDPSSGRATRLYELTLRERAKWKELDEVLTSAVEHVSGRDERLGLLLSLARLLAKTLEEPARATGYYERVLELLPASEEALGFLVAHFTENKQWDHLVALYEDALRARQLKADAEHGILLQIAMVHWKMLGRPDRAEPYFARVRKADPSQPVMLDFYREQYSTMGEPTKLVAILSDAQRRATTDGDKLKLSLEIARVAQNDPQAAERAIDAFKLVLRHEPGHAEALSSLKQLYRRSGKWNALVELLRAELDVVKDGELKDKLALLHELLAIYRDELKLEASVLSTYNAILQLDPTNVEAAEQLSRTYESMGRFNDLIPVLMREAEAESVPKRKVALYLRVGKLWIEHFSNYNQAAGPLEQVLALDPDNREALVRMREIYTKKRAWKQLAQVLAKEAELNDDPAQQKNLLFELAVLSGERLHEYPEAIALWKRLLTLEPGSARALDALEKLAERAKDWDTLAETLEHRVAQADDAQGKIRLLTRVGTLHNERTLDPARAAAAWKRVLALDPKNGRALRTLREAYLAAGDFDSVEALYAEANDWEGFVDVLGAAADRTGDGERKKSLSFRAAEIYEKKLNEPARAFRAYERVLGVEPDNERAVRALLPLYEKDEKWPKVAQLLDVLLAKASGKDERLPLLGRLSDVYAAKLRDGEKAFALSLQAYELAPTHGDVRVRLEQVGEQAGLHERLAQSFAARADKAKGEEAIFLRRRVAQIAAERLKKPDEAAAQLEKVLEQRPDDQEAQDILERIYRTTSRYKDLQSLYARKLELAQDDAQKSALLLALASLEENELSDRGAAIGRFQALRAIAKGDRTILAELDRLLSLEKRVTDLSDVLRARIELSEAPKERAELLLRLGALSLDELKDLEAARQAFADTLEADPNEGRAVAQLERIAQEAPGQALEIGRVLEPVYERTFALDKLSALLKGRLDASKSAADKRALKLRLSELSTAMGDPKNAYATLESAFLDSPQNPELWDKLGHAAERAGTFEELAVAFSTVIELGALEPAESAELSARTARVYDHVLGQPEKAEPFHARVLAHDPLADEAYQALRELFTNRERWEELKKLYRERIEASIDPQQKLELLLQVCFLFEEILDDVELAIRSYREVLDLDPQHSTSRRALERLYTRAERFKDLVALLEGDRAEVEGKEAIELSYRIGDLYEHKLSEPARAVDQYADVLAEQPTHLRAQEALGRLLAEPSQRQRVAGLLEPVYTQQGAHVELARVLEVQLEELTDRGARVAVLLRLGGIYERELRDAEAAFRALTRAVEADPADATARAELARIAQAAGKFNERAALLEAVLPKVDDREVRKALLRELSDLWDISVADPVRAIDAYARLIAADPEDPENVLPAARALERLHTVAEDYPSLAEDLRKQIDFEADVEAKKTLLSRLAELCETQLKSIPRAIAAYSERLALDSGDVPALLALERLYEAESQWENLISILEKRDPVAQDQDEARILCRRIGEIYEFKLKDTDGAILAYEEVISRFGNDRQTIISLSRVYELTERWTELLETVQTELTLATEPADRAEVRFRAAELMRLRTQAKEAALDAYRVVLEDKPGHEPTIRALNEVVAAGGATRIEAGRVLVPHYEAIGDNDSLIRALEVVAESDDASERLLSLRRASEVAERTGDAGRAYALMAKAAKAALLSDELAHVFDELHRLALASGRFEAYAALLREVSPEVMDEDVAITLGMRAAENARDRLSDRSLAREYFEKVLALRAEHEPALSALEALHEQAGDHRGLLAVLRKKTELAVDAKDRTRLLLRQAELSAGPLDDVSSAISAYESVLEETPTKDVFSGLEVLYRRAARHAELSAMYERQLDLEVGDPVVVRYRLAELWRQHLENPERALDLYEAVLERSPTHEETTRSLEAMLDQGVLSARVAGLLEPVYLRRSRWPELTRALEAQLSAEDSPERKKELLGRLGQLHEVQLEDLEAALETHARLFRVDPSDTHAWDTLGRLARVLGRQVRVAEVYEEYLDEVSVDDELSVKLAVSAAQIRDQHGHDLVRASKLYQRALAFNPGVLSIADALEDVLIRKRDSEELRSFYRAQVDAASDDTRRVSVLHKLGKVTENELREHASAIRVYQEILEVSGGDEPAIRELDRLLTEAGRYTDLAEHINYQVGLAGDGTSEEAQLKLRLARLYEERLDDVNKGVDTYEDILRGAPKNPEARAALERLCARAELLRRVADILSPLYEGAGEWEKQIWLAEKLVSSESDVAERSQLYGQIARLYEERGQNLESSLSAWRRALSTDPSDDHARSELTRIAASVGDWDALVAAFEEAIETTVDNAVKASLLAQVAETHDQKRGDPRAAISAYERLVQIDSEDSAPLSQLESLLTMVGDWHGVVNLYKRKVERSYDAVERAELWRRAGSVLDDLLSDAEGAIRAYVAAIEEVSEDELALSALDDLYQRTENYQALADVLRRRVDLITDQAERADANLRLGATLAEKLSRTREAIDAYERALEDDPGSLAALVPLSSLYEAESMWAELLDSLRKQLELVKEQGARLSLLYRIGQVLDERLSEPEEAIDSYQRVLQIDGAHEPTIKALFRLGEQVEYRTRVEEILEPHLRSGARWDEVATLLTRGISALSDPFDRQRRYLALAQIHEQHRSDARAAFDALCEALLQDAEDGTIVPELTRLAGSLSLWERTAEVIDRRAASSSDPQLARDLYRRLAGIAEGELKDVAQTIEANEQALERAGDDEEILAELTRLYTETRRFDDLAEVLERRVSLVDTDAAIELLLRLGEIRLREFDDARAALSAYRDVLERKPGEPRAIAALEAMLGGNTDLAHDVIDLLDDHYRKAGELQRVADLYEVRLKLTDSPGERVSLLTELSGLWEREGKDLDKAGKALRRAFEADPTDYGLLDEVERVANASGQFDVLRGLVEAATRVPNLVASDVRDLWIRAAGWYSNQLKDNALAEGAYRQALIADPDYEPAHEGLSALLRTAGKESELVLSLIAWAERESDRGVATERLLEAARVAEQTGDMERAVACYERALTFDENSIEALDRLIKAHESQGRLGKVVQLYERRIALEDNAAQRVSMRHRAASIRRAQLDDEKGAVRLYRENLEDQPDDVASLDALEQLYEQGERWDDLVRVIEQRLDVAQSAAERATARVRLARVSEKQLKNPGRAIDELREIVMEVPTHPEANQELERLLESQGRFSDLVEQLTRKVDLLLDAGEKQRAYAAQARAAEIVHKELGDRERAQEEYERLLERDPSNVAALRSLAGIYAQAGDPERAAKMLETLIDRVDGEERVSLSFQLSELAEGELKSRERAEAALRLALATPLRTAETRERLFALSERHKDYQGLSNLLSEEAEIASDPAQKVQLLRRASDLSRVELKDPSRAASLLERAIAFAPEDRAVLIPLCELYIAAGRQADAVPVLQKIIASYGGRRVKEVAGFHHMLARAFSGMGDPKKALAELDAAYRVDLTNVGVLKDLGLMAYEQGDFERAQKTFRGLLLQRLDRDAPISKADVYYYLGEISRQQGDAQKAISMLERAVAEQASHERAKTLLSSLKS